MAKKRTSLDALFNNTDTEEIVEREVEPLKNTVAVTKNPVKATKTNQTDKLIVKQTVYLPAQVYEQLRSLAFEERKKMHDYLVEGLDRVFKNRGLKSYNELVK
jgi:hypothetical protein